MITWNQFIRPLKINRITNKEYNTLSEDLMWFFKNGDLLNITEEEINEFCNLLMEIDEEKRESMIDEMSKSYKYFGYKNPFKPVDPKDIINDHVLMIIAHDNFMIKK